MRGIYTYEMALVHPLGTENRTHFCIVVVKVKAYHRDFNEVGSSGYRHILKDEATCVDIGYVR